jgi:hypothetical protein
LFAIIDSHGLINRLVNIKRAIDRNLAAYQLALARLTAD